MAYRSRTAVADLVVVAPGILGSRLATGEGEVWGLSGRALWRGIRTFGGSVKSLALPRDIGDDAPADGVRATGLMRDLHALPSVWSLVDGYSGLLRWLEQYFTVQCRPEGAPDRHPANLVPFAYDWRLSCRYNAQRLKAVIDRELGLWRASAPERGNAEVIFLCHSMGGLVTRYYVECLGGAEVTRRVITLGTPNRGSLDALLSLVNGLSRGIPLMRLDLTAFARSLPSLHQLTPEYACLDVPGGLRYARELPGLPGVDAALLADAARFHEELRGAGASVPYTTVTGALQPTPTTAGVDGEDEGGDGRVPFLSASNGLRPAFTPWEQHGSLQNNAAVRQFVWGLLTPDPPVHRGVEDETVPLCVDAPEFLGEGEDYAVDVSVPKATAGHDTRAISATLTEAGTDRTVARRTLANLGDGRYRTLFPAFPAGAYRVTVTAGAARHTAVTALLLVEPRELRNHD